jgi:hypothetical protein
VSTAGVLLHQREHQPEHAGEDEDPPQGVDLERSHLLLVERQRQDQSDDDEAYRPSETHDELHSVGNARW